jgi:hypothetical protein
MATKLTSREVADERQKLKDYIGQAQYEYNCCFDERVEAEANGDPDEIEEANDAFDDAEDRLFHFEKVLEDFNKEYPEDE